MVFFCNLDLNEGADWSFEIHLGDLIREHGNWRRMRHLKPDRSECLLADGEFSNSDVIYIRAN